MKKEDSKQPDTVSVLDFAAVGDGVTDDAYAIQQAIGFLTETTARQLMTPSWVVMDASSLWIGVVPAF